MMLFSTIEILTHRKSISEYSKPELLNSFFSNYITHSIKVTNLVIYTKEQTA